MKNSTHIKEVSREFELCQFNISPLVKGFDTHGFFVVHLHTVGYSNLTGIFSTQEDDGVLGSLETVVSLNI